MGSKNKRTSSSYALAKIKVVGVGGGGSNAAARMSRDFGRNIEFIAINTDHQDLDHCNVRHKVYIGKNLTHGLGTGMNPELGRQAAEENRSDIAEAVRGADLVFLAAGLGGGTGTGAIPVVAEAAKQAGAVTLAFVTKPFSFEGNQRDRIALEGLAKLRDKVDALVVVPNDRIFAVISKETPIVKAFEAIDDVMKNALKGIVELIVSPGIINVDFADVKAIIQDAGSAIVGLGIASGADRAAVAVKQAITSPLLEVSPEGAKGVLLGVSGRDLKMNEVNEAAKMIAKISDPSARIIFGAYHDRSLRQNQMKITLIATGFNGSGHASTLFASSRPSFLEDSVPKMEEFGIKSDEKISHEAPKSHQEKSLQRGVNPPFDKLEKTKKKENDIWDIPTFLRKRRK